MTSDTRCGPLHLRPRSLAEAPGKETTDKMIQSINQITNLQLVVSWPRFTIDASFSAPAHQIKTSLDWTAGFLSKDI